MASLSGELKLMADLKISHPNFILLTQNLRAVIDSRNPGAGVSIGEIETPSATVRSVNDLVVTRCGQ